MRSQPSFPTATRSPPDARHAARATAERAARRAPAPRTWLFHFVCCNLTTEGHSKMLTSAAQLFPNENPDLREEVKSVLPNGAAWLDTQNFLFEGRKPADLIGTPEEFRVRDVLRAVKHGFIS